MNIVLCTDINYLTYCLITICSVCENNKDSKISFYIISKELSQKDKQIFIDFLSHYKEKTVIFIDTQDDLTYIFPIGNKEQNNYISIMSYYRLFLTRFLPETLNKIIYLDCDILVRSSLNSLWNIDISEYALGGVLDTLSFDINTYNRLQYSPASQYINAGVLLINLKYWRQHNVISQFIEFAQKYPERLKYHDQDILNSVFQSNKKIIPFTYNFHDGLFRKELKVLYNYWDEIFKTEKSPCIVHFSAHIKPWHTDCVHPYVSEYDFYKQKTPFYNLKKIKRNYPFSFKVKKHIKQLLSLINLCNKVQPEIEYRNIFVPQNKYRNISL